MITGEQRRDAALFLRGCDCTAEECEECRRISGSLLGNENAFCDMNVSFARLADLIDRPTCTNQGDDWTFLCSNCGECVTITKEIPCGGAEAPYRPYYCPGCGAEVVEDD